MRDLQMIPRPRALPLSPRQPSPDIQYRDAIRKHGRLALGILLVAVAAVTVGSLLRTPIYRAAGLLEIKRESAGAVPVEALFTPEGMADEDVQTEFGILTSTTLAERVVAQVGLPDATRDSWWSTPDDTGAATAPGAVQHFRERLIVNPREGSRLVEVSFRSADPEFAARAVNSLLDNYLQLRMEDTQRSAQWLTAQLGEARNRLEDSQRRMHAYVRQHGLDIPKNPNGEPLATSILRQLHEQLVAAQGERYLKQAAYESAAKRAARRDLESRVIESVSVRLAELRQEQARLAAVFHDGYPKVKELKSQIAELEQIVDDETQLAVRRVDREYKAALRREALLRQRLAEQQRSATALGDKLPGYEALKREVETNQLFYTALDERLKAVAASAALKAANVGIVDRARPPDEADNTPLALNLALGLLLGLVLAGGTVVVREHFDTSVRTAIEIQDVTGTPALAVIPAIALGNGNGNGHGHGSVRALLGRSNGRARALFARSNGRVRALLGTPNGKSGSLNGSAAAEHRHWCRIDQDGRERSPVAEAFAALRTAVLLGRQADLVPARVLLVTSARSGAGKTTVAVNLAVSFARLGHRVLVIDANLRHPCVHHVLGMENHGELASCLIGRTHWRTVVRRSPVPDLDVLVAGTPERHPAELLALPGMRQLVEEAVNEYEFVIVDSPTLSTYPADVCLLAAVADNVVLTVRSGSTSREEISHAVEQLRHRTVGVVLNGLESHSLSHA